MKKKEKRKDWYTTEKVDWDTFLRKVKQYEKDGAYIYRGQSSEKQKLKSSFDRAVSASQELNKKRWIYEAAILREFMRRAHQYVTHVPGENDLLEWMALMRHYGAPTRLVDFTYSHYIAAYFAFSSVVCTTRAIWAVRLDWLQNETKRKTDKDNLHDAENFKKYFLALEHAKSFVAAMNAERMNERLTIQQGVFLCPGNIEQSFWQNLRSLKYKKNSIVKFIIPHEARNRALTELNHMNISKATLFPDLGGFAESLNDRFEFLFKDFDVPEKILRDVVSVK